MATAATPLRLHLHFPRPASAAAGVVETSYRVTLSPPQPGSASLALPDISSQKWQRCRRGGRLVAHAQAPQGSSFERQGGSCCGESGSGGGGCSSNASKGASVSGVGKEFEAMVAKSTMAEFEKDYVTGEMQGMITRDVVREVMTIPEAQSISNEERFLDVDQLLSDARKLSSGDFVFDADLDAMIV